MSGLPWSGRPGLVTFGRDVSLVVTSSYKFSVEQADRRSSVGRHDG